MRNNLFLLIIFWVLLICSRFSFATEYIAECQNLDYIFQKADVVVSGEVIKVEAKRETNGTICTYTDIKVMHYLKGDGSGLITIKQFGGTIGDETIGRGYSTGFITGESGYLYLNKINSKFYENKFYGLVCGYGITDALPANVPQRNW